MIKIVIIKDDQTDYLNNFYDGQNNKKSIDHFEMVFQEGSGLFQFP